MQTVTDDKLARTRDEIVYHLERQGPLTKDGIMVRLRPPRLSAEELIGCLSYLIVKGRIEREEGCRYALTRRKPSCRRDGSTED